jgi:hypothetical protein
LRIFTVHLGPRSGPFAGAGARELALVKEGFCWPAALFTVLWALWHRLWFTAAALVLVPGVIYGALEYAGLDTSVRVAAVLGIRLVVGLFANDWRRLELARRGFEEAGVVAARGLDAAELRAAERLGLGAGAPLPAHLAR